MPEHTFPVDIGWHVITQGPVSWAEVTARAARRRRRLAWERTGGRRARTAYRAKTRRRNRR